MREKGTKKREKLAESLSSSTIGPTMPSSPTPLSPPPGPLPEEEEIDERTEEEKQRDREKEREKALRKRYEGSLKPRVTGYNLGRPCRSVDCYEKLNKIEEGTFGIVFRAKDRQTNEIVALKQVKMEREKEGFPVTSLREFKLLMALNHENVVNVKEIVVGKKNRFFIVMEYLPHDLKALMEVMPSRFSPSEVKCLLLQLLRAIAYLHDQQWVIHRDLKASNILLNNRGILKVADFGLAREYGSPLKEYTSLVVTLWYRSPELLLGCTKYRCEPDMWSVGCIFAELLQHKPLFPGKGEIDQMLKIFKTLGSPTPQIWEGLNDLPNVAKTNFPKQPFNYLRKTFPATFLTESGYDLLNKMLTYDPKKRITAKEALEHPYFTESPLPQDPSMMPTYPSQAEGGRRKKRIGSGEIPRQDNDSKFLDQPDHVYNKKNAFILK
mmetsp:Transcript_36739/g.57713  ORF Transcript_36739/g.57713 Transcript_36739/m.57713 type:complete len:438 (-) Transcript_36739:139-1452(-)